MPDGATLFVDAKHGDFEASSASGDGDQGAGGRGGGEERVSEGDLPAGGSS